MSEPLCPTHHKPGRVIYPCCLGTVGGSQTSNRKRRAGRATLDAIRERSTPESRRAAALKAWETRRRGIAERVAAARAAAEAAYLASLRPRRRRAAPE